VKIRLAAEDESTTLKFIFLWGGVGGGVLIFADAVGRGAEGRLRLLEKENLRLRYFDYDPAGVRTGSLGERNSSTPGLKPYGMVWSRGPRVGKTNTLYSSISLLNKPGHQHITPKMFFFFLFRLSSIARVPQVQ